MLRASVGDATRLVHHQPMPRSLPLLRHRVYSYRSRAHHQQPWVTAFQCHSCASDEANTLSQSTTGLTLASHQCFIPFLHPDIASIHIAIELVVHDADLPTLQLRAIMTKSRITLPLSPLRWISPPPLVCSGSFPVWNSAKDLLLRRIGVKVGAWLRLGCMVETDSDDV